MDRSRTPLLVAAVGSFAAALFAIGAGVATSDDESVAVTIAPAPASGAPSLPPASAPADGVEPSATAQFDIVISGFEFGPGEAVVAVGTEVVWTNNDGFEHSVVADGDAFPASPTLGEGETYRVTFTEPGTYTYICGIHPQMTGTIVVEG